MRFIVNDIEESEGNHRHAKKNERAENHGKMVEENAQTHLTDFLLSAYRSQPSAFYTLTCICRKKVTRYGKSMAAYIVDQ